MRTVEAMEAVGVLRGLRARERRRLEWGAQLRTLRRHERLWEEGDRITALWFVVQGRLKLLMSRPHGIDVGVGLVSVGSLACAGAAGPLSSYCCRAVALDAGTQVLGLDPDSVIEVVTADPARARTMMHEISGHAQRRCVRVDELSAGKVEQRLAAVVGRLLAQGPVDRQSNGELVHAALSRRDLAELAGTTVESAIRGMRRLERCGVIETVAGGFLVKDRPALLRLAGRHQH